MKLRTEHSLVCPTSTLSRESFRNPLTLSEVETPYDAFAFEEKPLIQSKRVRVGLRLRSMQATSEYINVDDLEAEGVDSVSERRIQEGTSAYR